MATIMIIYIIIANFKFTINLGFFRYYQLFIIIKSAAIMQLMKKFITLNFIIMGN